MIVQPDERAPPAPGNASGEEGRVPHATFTTTSPTPVRADISYTYIHVVGRHRHRQHPRVLCHELLGRLVVVVVVAVLNLMNVRRGAGGAGGGRGYLVVSCLTNLSFRELPSPIYLYAHVRTKWYCTPFRDGARGGCCVFYLVVCGECLR